MKDRLVGQGVEPSWEQYRRMYHRALGAWASQMLVLRAEKARIEWVEPDPPGSIEDLTRVDWQKLYQGSVLDD